jgi:heme oxygenase (staphylobilin-producing)
VIVVTSRIVVVSDNANEVAHAYATRLRQADRAPGCLGIEILRHLERPGEFVVYSRWQALTDYEAYRRSDAFRAAHSRIGTLNTTVKVSHDRSLDAYEVLS